jgi:hypothetical protein
MPAARSSVDTASADTPSEFAQLIQSLSPELAEPKTTPGTGNAPPQPVGRGSAQKMASIAPQPVSPGTGQKTGNATAQPVNTGTARPAVKTTPVEQTAKIANAGASPVIGTVAEPGETWLGPEGTPASPSQSTDDPVETAAIPKATSRATQNTADVSSALETNTPAPAPKQESTEAAPMESQSMRKPASAKSNDSPLPAAIAIATPVLPLPLPPVASRMAVSNAPPPQPSIEAPPQEPSSAPALTAAPALEVRIRATEQPKDDATPAAPGQPQLQTQTQLQTEIPVLAKAVSSPVPAEAQVQVQAQPQLNPVAALAQPPAPPSAASRTERPVSQPARSYEAAAEPTLRSQTQAQPLRSVSLEFTPDGAADVRLRLSERGGDVHIELHATDSALTGRLSEGVHDLAASLVNAGYDAQAWTPGQEREDGRGQQQEDPSGKQRDQGADPDAEDFDTAMQEPMKEFS